MRTRMYAPAPAGRTNNREKVRRLTTAVAVLGGAVALGGLAGPVGAAGAEELSARYIVVLQPGLSSRDVATEHASRSGVAVRALYEHAIAGYAAEMTRVAAASVASDPRVAVVELDQTIGLAGQFMDRGIDRVHEPSTPATTLSNIAIDNVDQRVDVDIAIIDTAIDMTHPDLVVAQAVGCTPPRPVVDDVVASPCTARTANPYTHATLIGHGTHVAGIAAAKDNNSYTVGVAAGARLHSVDVFGSSSGAAMSWILGGVDWVTAHADTIEVANMSLGGVRHSAALDLAIRNSVAAGVTYVVAAGNSSTDAGLYTPANHPDVITVSSLSDADGRSGGLVPTETASCTPDDALSDFSNYGAVVDMVAPGCSVGSTWPGYSYWWASGTSMAAPHVAGAAGLLASRPEFRGRPDLIRSTLIATGNTDWTDTIVDPFKEPLLDVTSEVFSPVLLGDPGPNVVPTADLAVRCRNSTVCTAKATKSTDPDGTIVAYHWSSHAPVPAGPVTAGEIEIDMGSFSGETYMPVSVSVYDDYGDVSDWVTVWLRCAPVSPTTSACEVDRAL